MDSPTRAVPAGPRRVAAWSTGLKPFWSSSNCSAGSAARARQAENHHSEQHRVVRDLGERRERARRLEREPKARAAARVVPSLALRSYRVTFEFRSADEAAS